MTLNSCTVFSSSGASLTGLISTSEPGKNALTTSTSTEKPPLTLVRTLPSTNSPVSRASSSFFQVPIFLAFSREILVSPYPSSTASKATCTSSPDSISTDPSLFLNSSKEITPSDFNPTWTVTHSLSTSSTTPVTIEPGCISSVLRLSSNSAAKLSDIFFILPWYFLYKFLILFLILLEELDSMSSLLLNHLLALKGRFFSPYLPRLAI